MRKNDVHQDIKWITATGDILLLEEMSPRHLSDVLAFLRRRAGSFKFWDDIAVSRGLQPMTAGEFDDVESAMHSQFDTRADLWLESTPLVRRLRVLTGEQSPNAHVPLSF